MKNLLVALFFLSNFGYAQTFSGIKNLEVLSIGEANFDDDTSSLNCEEVKVKLAHLYEDTFTKDYASIVKWNQGTVDSISNFLQGPNALKECIKNRRKCGPVASEWNSLADKNIALLGIQQSEFGQILREFQQKDKEIKASVAAGLNCAQVLATLFEDFENVSKIRDDYTRSTLTISTEMDTMTQNCVPYDSKDGARCLIEVMEYGIKKRQDLNLLNAYFEAATTTFKY